MDSERAYVLYDSYGAPQCGCEVKEFDAYNDLMEYLDDNPEVYERLHDGYASCRIGVLT